MGESMSDTTQKDKGMIVQVIGFVFLFLGFRGFLVFRHTVLYIPAVIVGILLFLACLIWGGFMVRKGKPQQK